MEYWTTALGEWKARPDGTVAMIFVSLGTDETGTPAGTHTVTATATIDLGGDTWSGPFQIAVTDGSGSPAGQIEGTVSAERIEVSM